MEGVPAQLRTLAGYMPDPMEIARHLDKFTDVLALPRFAHLVGESNLTIATELVNAVKAELELMKRPRLGETDLEAAQRELRANEIDGIYVLTTDWQQYKNITVRRRVLIGKKPDDENADTHGFREGPERVIHEELAIRLSRDDPPERQDVLKFEEAYDFASDLCYEVRSLEGTAKASQSERFKDSLIEFVRKIDAITATHQLIILFIAQLEREDALRDREPLDHEAELDTLVAELEDPAAPYRASTGIVHIFAQRWPWFNRRDWSLLGAAFSQSDGELDPFLEYLETRDRGRAVLTEWCRWVATADWMDLISYYGDARSHLMSKDGEGDRLLEEIAREPRYEERLFGDLSDLCELGAILFKASPDSGPPQFSYRLYTARQREYVPDNWEVLAADKLSLELERYLTEFFERANMWS